MDKRVVILLSLAIGVAIGVALAWGLRRATAQDGAPAGAAVPVAIAPGPGGMWVVYGNRVRVCGGGLVEAGTEPPIPECAEPVTLY